MQEEPGGPEMRIVGRVTPESFRGWRDYCNRHGVTRSAYIESLGILMGETVNQELTPLALRVIDLAKRIDAERLRRSAD